MIFVCSRSFFLFDFLGIWTCEVLSTFFFVFFRPSKIILNYNGGGRHWYMVPDLFGLVLIFHYLGWFFLKIFGNRFHHNFPHFRDNCWAFFFFNKFIYLFLAALGLHCCTWASSSCRERGLLFVVVRGLLIAVASLVAEHGP